MLFTILKFFQPLLDPLGLIWLFCLAATAVLLWRRQRLGALFMGSAALLISLVGSSFSTMLLRSLEKPYASLSLETRPPADAVLLLGGSVAPSQRDPVGFDLNLTADRVVLALDLMQRGKAPVLLLGGAGFQDDGGTHRNESELLLPLLKRWGLTNFVVHVLPPATDTFDEAKKARDLCRDHGWDDLVVVTSASHMQRAEAIFHQLGAEITPAACDFQTLGRTRRLGGWDPWPSPQCVLFLKNYLHEVVGTVIYHRRGWLGREREVWLNPKESPEHGTTAASGGGDEVGLEAEPSAGRAPQGKAGRSQESLEKP